MIEWRPPAGQSDETLSKLKVFNWIENLWLLVISIRLQPKRRQSRCFCGVFFDCESFSCPTPNSLNEKRAQNCLSRRVKGKHGLTIVIVWTVRTISCGCKMGGALRKVSQEVFSSHSTDAIDRFHHMFRSTLTCIAQSFNCFSVIDQLKICSHACSTWLFNLFRFFSIERKIVCVCDSGDRRQRSFKLQVKQKIVFCAWSAAVRARHSSV